MDKVQKEQREVYLTLLYILGEGYQIFAVSIKGTQNRRIKEKMSFQAVGKSIQKDIPHSGMFLKIEPFMHGYDRGLCAEVVRMKWNIFLESDQESPCITLKAQISNQHKEWFSNYVPQNPIIPQKPQGLWLVCEQE